MRVRSVLLLAGAAYLVYYAVQNRVRVLRTVLEYSDVTNTCYQSAASLPTSAHRCRIWGWGAAELGRTGRRGRPRQVCSPVCCHSGCSAALCDCWPVVEMVAGRPGSVIHNKLQVLFIPPLAPLNSWAHSRVPAAVKPHASPRHTDTKSCRQGWAAAHVQAGL